MASFIEKVIESAYRHGSESEPDMETGDLQEVVRALWKLMPPLQRKLFVGDPRWREFIETWPTRRPSRRVKSEAICPKCESTMTHRCNTGDEGCWHCEDCEHSWLASKTFSLAKVRS